MNPSDPALRHPGVDETQEIDRALAFLAAVEPREGLEQRILTRLAAAPELPWYRRFASAPMGRRRWAVAAAAAVIVAGSVAGSITMTGYRRHSAVVPLPVVAHLPHALPQAAAAAASIGVSNHPLEMNKTKTRHRGVRKSYRAIHDRVPLPRGTVAPLRPNAVPVTQ